MYIFNKFKIIELIDKLFISMRQHTIETEENERKTSTRSKSKITIPQRTQRIQKISDQIKINEITAKAFAYYLFLVFFRLAIVFI
ncbi:MAG: hypothetical protein LBQ59_05480 [Candidatus Peribacteria bacterium]|jgi:hypothetical protein|nr:hypothetical protein [Candidatus Peribacteria bacterium]